MLDLRSISFELFDEVTDGFLIALIVVVAGVEDQVWLHLVLLHDYVVWQVEVEQVFEVGGSFSEDLRATEEIWEPLMLHPLRVFRLDVAAKPTGKSFEKYPVDLRFQRIFRKGRESWFRNRAIWPFFVIVIHLRNLPFVLLGDSTSMLEQLGLVLGLRLTEQLRGTFL